jgi:cysteine desulfurase / selenocysteine lyase
MSKNEGRRMKAEQNGGGSSFILHPSSLLESQSYDVHAIRNDFPILARDIRGKRLVYLDNAATTQKPRQVIDRLVRYYTEENSNVHRGVHYLSELATMEYENARGVVQRFIHANSEKEIVFTRGTTESSRSTW